MLNYRTFYSDYTNGVKKTTVGQGPPGVDEACLLVEASETCAPDDIYEHH